jgi:uncharacterized protein DUF4440
MSRLTACVLTIGFAVALAGPSRAQDEGTKKAAASGKEAKQELLDLSKQKWLWMAERKVEELDALFHEEAVFVHMGGSMTRAQELEVIKSGNIQYKKADIRDSSARVIGSTAIVLNRIRLLAVVGGNEVTNPFVVTEVYVQQDGKWKLAQLSFTRTLGN